MTAARLKDEMQCLGQKPFRAGQVFTWLHKKDALDFSDMTDLNLELREICNQNYYINRLETVKKLVSAEDGTVKYLFKLCDGNFIESVFLKYKNTNSICISTQVGCKMGCDFCASTKDGFTRNLSSAEMLDQVYTTETDTGCHISNIVLMGIGEPLENTQNVLDFIEIISDKDGRNISRRSITLSTCGLADEMMRLADYKLPVTLAVSLHAANDELRNKLMPINKKYNISTLMEACRYYFNKTGRRISFEYALISGVNDSARHAQELARLLKGFSCHVNLIEVNEIKERRYNPAGNEKLKDFVLILKENSVNVTIRRKLGASIDAACGQLRRSQL